MSASETSPCTVGPVSPTAVDAVEGESAKRKQREDGDREQWEAEGYQKAAAATSAASASASAPSEAAAAASTSFAVTAFPARAKRPAAFPAAQAALAPAAASSSSSEARPTGQDHHHHHHQGHHEEERKDQGEDEDGSYHEEFEDQDESAPRVRFARSPSTPTKAEREEHEIHHTPFRSWCVHCVRGRSIASPHKSKGGEPREHQVPVVAMDYTFLGGQEDEAVAPVIVIKDGASGATMSQLVPCKGASVPWVQKSVSGFIRFLGYARLILKSDQEPAILELRKEIINGTMNRQCEIIEEDALVKESRSNGMIENAIREVQGMVRTFKDHVEAKCGISLPRDSPLIPWIVLHAGRVITSYKIQKDGRTAFERLRGKRARTNAIPIGEKILYQPVRHQTKREKLDSRWEYGIYVGFVMQSMEALVAGSRGVVKARNVRRLSEDQRRDKDMLEEMKGTPWEPRGERGKGDIPVDIPDTKGDPGVEPPPQAPRRVRIKITKDDLRRHGATEGCPGCKATLHGRYTAAHLEVCRKRLEQAIASTPLGASRMDRYRQRQDQQLAEELEKHVKKARTQEKEQAGDDDVESRMNDEGRDDDHFEDAQEEGREDPRGEKRGHGEDGAEETGGRHGKKARNIEDADEEVKGSKRRSEDDDHAADVPERRKKKRPEGRVQAVELEGEMRHEKNAIAEVKRFMNKDALDLTMPKEDGTMWDLSISDDKMLIDKFIKRHKPKIIIGTSMNGHAGNDVLHMGRAIDHTRGLCEVYNRQLNAGLSYPSC